jgi:hypothetical protein
VTVCGEEKGTSNGGEEGESNLPIHHKVHTGCGAHSDCNPIYFTGSCFGLIFPKDGVGHADILSRLRIPEAITPLPIHPHAVFNGVQLRFTFTSIRFIIVNIVQPRLIKYVWFI